MRCGLEQVSFAYEGKRVLDRVDVDLPDRGGVCLFGPSGCGKTTALRLLAGLEQPDAGRVVGMDGRCITVLFQENRLLPWCTVEENVLLGMGEGQGDRGKVRTMLDAVGLLGDAQQLPDALSGGMQRRVALARALVRRSDVLLLDEPLKELDEQTALAMRDLIKEHANDKLLVLVTHDLAEAKALCDTVLICAGPPLSIKGQASAT